MAAIPKASRMCVPKAAERSHSCPAREEPGAAGLHHPYGSRSLRGHHVPTVHEAPGSPEHKLLPAYAAQRASDAALRPRPLRAPSEPPQSPLRRVAPGALPGRRSGRAALPAALPPLTGVFSPSRKACATRCRRNAPRSRCRLLSSVGHSSQSRRKRRYRLAAMAPGHVCRSRGAAAGSRARAAGRECLRGEIPSGAAGPKQRPVPALSAAWRAESRTARDGGSNTAPGSPF